MKKGLDDIQQKIEVGLLEAITNVTKNRKKYYEGTERPSFDKLTSIIKDCSNTNATISGSVGLIPGPYGMAAAVPEITLIIRNQLNMIYDIGVAHGKETHLNNELILGILVGSFGNGAVGLLAIHGQKVMTKRVGQRVIQSVIQVLGGKITQQVAKSMAAKWIPIVGAIAMAGWSKYSTNIIGEKAIEIFSKEIINEDTNELVRELNKIKVISNLMKIDGKKHTRELSYIVSMIDATSLPSSEKKVLQQGIEIDSLVSVDYSVFKGYKEESILLLIDLVAIAKIDGEYHMKEQEYIQDIALHLGITNADLEKLE